MLLINTAYVCGHWSILTVPSGPQWGRSNSRRRLSTDPTSDPAKPEVYRTSPQASVVEVVAYSDTSRIKTKVHHEHDLVVCQACVLDILSRWHSLVHKYRSLALCPEERYFTLLTSPDSCVNEYLLIGSERSWQIASAMRLTGVCTVSADGIWEVAGAQWSAQW